MRSERVPGASPQPQSGSQVRVVHKVWAREKEEGNYNDRKNAIDFLKFLNIQFFFLILEDSQRPTTSRLPDVACKYFLTKIVNA